MKNLKQLFSFQRASVFLLALPYLAFNWADIKFSPFFSFTQLTLALFCLFIFDTFIKWILTRLNNKLEAIITMVIVFISIIFFYGFYITDFFRNSIHQHLNILIRGRIIIMVLMVIFSFLVIHLRNIIFSYIYFNIFLILFSSINFISAIKNSNQNLIREFKSNYIHISDTISAIKPIILIICDEYNSPDGLFKVYKDSSVYQFSEELINNGWIVKNSFYTYEKSTIHSLSSLFNFNLSTSQNYGQEQIANIGFSKFNNATIADSFKQKGVNVYNFGIFDLGEYKALSGNLYRYPKTFFEYLMLHSSFFLIKDNTGNFNKNGFFSNFYPMELHNKYIFNDMLDSLKKNKNPQTFIYTHLYMPHRPMQFTPEFPLRTEYNLNNYTAFWNFTNTKLTVLLNSLIKENKFKIILTGDHGYRGDKSVNSNYTFVAFYGFEKTDIENVESVQDLGSLINCNYPFFNDSLELK